MGDSIKKLYEDYEDYRELCERRGIKPLHIGDSKSFYDHEEQILKEIQKGRSSVYYQMTPEEQWEEDKRLGILDWDGK